VHDTMHIVQCDGVMCMYTSSRTTINQVLTVLAIELRSRYQGSIAVVTVLLCVAVMPVVLY
jgi:hypothetical protein